VIPLFGDVAVGKAVVALLDDQDVPAGRQAGAQVVADLGEIGVDLREDGLGRPGAVLPVTAGQSELEDGIQRNVPRAAGIGAAASRSRGTMARSIRGGFAPVVSYIHCPGLSSRCMSSQATPASARNRA
jgi:hypothetical protein